MNRMGLRLSGPALHHKISADILSDGIVKGAIQVPGDGQPIILMADHQTTGGYTKIATVISADLAKLTRLHPHRTVRFTLSVRKRQSRLQMPKPACCAKIWQIEPHCNLDKFFKSLNHVVIRSHSNQNDRATE